MSTPAKPIPLGRAPRPRTNPEDLAQLVAGGAEAGFARPLAPPEPAAEPMPVQAPAAPAPSPAMYDGPVSPLRLEVPDLIWLALKMESAKRKVSVKYLVIEALAAKGYAEGLDLSLVPEDGRRNTKR
ncbi:MULTISPECIES: hypothetical protein [Methylobacterium]|jgi:hypothetical protein|uniref:Uncharacterized protein n=1 Tax=Methylobacterium nonmethylotrophicum TaxID=1141884 RepID=A0A4Z0NCR5_9HYPH|nr:MULTISPECIES: hypothetical protein [Methylobacterium]TGD91809.1 hypothetical protein EU555_35525 [Methylobacterium nonmethylotrophicum]SFF72160.1 hypothetical protein SAMN04487844_14219 [Methylobacterium sp. yr596]